MPFLRMPKGSILAPSEHNHRTGAIQALLDEPRTIRNSLLELWARSPRTTWATLNVIRTWRAVTKARGV